MIPLAESSGSKSLAPPPSSANLLSGVIEKLQLTLPLVPNVNDDPFSKRTSWTRPNVENVMLTIREAIDTLEALLPSLEREADDHCVEQLRVRNRSLPSVSLPTEVLVAIFEWTCLASCSRQDIDQARRETMSDWNPRAWFMRSRRRTLASVCSLWREIAVSTSSLWNTVVLLSTEKPTSDIHRIAEVKPLNLSVIALEVERCGSRPVAVQCNMSKQDWNSTISAIPGLYSRCSVLALTALDSQPPLDWKDANTVHPVLHTMLLDYPVFVQPDGRFSLPFSYIPSLRNLQMKTTSIPHYRTPLQFARSAVAGLERLSLAGYSSVQEFVHLLAYCPNIITLSLSGFHMSRDAESLDVPMGFALPKIRNLHMAPHPPLFSIISASGTAPLERVSLALAVRRNAPPTRVHPADAGKAIVSEISHHPSVHYIALDIPRASRLMKFPDHLSQIKGLRTVVLGAFGQVPDNPPPHALKRWQDVLCDIAIKCPAVEDIWLTGPKVNHVNAWHIVHTLAGVEPLNGNPLLPRLHVVKTSEEDWLWRNYPRSNLWRIEIHEHPGEEPNVWNWPSEYENGRMDP